MLNEKSIMSLTEFETQLVVGGVKLREKKEPKLECNCICPEINCPEPVCICPAPEIVLKKEPEKESSKKRFVLADLVEQGFEFITVPSGTLVERSNFTTITLW